MQIIIKKKKNNGDVSGNAGRRGCAAQVTGQLSSMPVRSTKLRGARGRAREFQTWRRRDHRLVPCRCVDIGQGSRTGGLSRRAGIYGPSGAGARLSRGIEDRN